MGAVLQHGEQGRQSKQPPLAEHLRARGDGPVALAEAGTFYGKLGEALEAIVRAHAQSAFRPQHRADRLLLQNDSSFVVAFADGRLARGKKFVLAMGGYQDRNAALHAQLLSGVTLRQAMGERVKLSGELLARGGRSGNIVRLAHLGRPARVAIVGSSHSAFCAADLPLRHLPAGALTNGSIEFISRSAPRPFYASPAAAHEDGHVNFSQDDVCPVTSRVFRLGGLRMASRQLLRAVLGLWAACP